MSPPTMDRITDLEVDNDILSQTCVEPPSSKSAIRPENDRTNQPMRGSLRKKPDKLKKRDTQGLLGIDVELTNLEMREAAAELAMEMPVTPRTRQHSSFARSVSNIGIGLGLGFNNPRRSTVAGMFFKGNNHEHPRLSKSEISNQLQTQPSPTISAVPAEIFADHTGRTTEAALKVAGMDALERALRAESARRHDHSKAQWKKAINAAIAVNRARKSKGVSSNDPFAQPGVEVVGSTAHEKPGKTKGKRAKGSVWTSYPRGLTTLGSPSSKKALPGSNVSSSAFSGPRASAAQTAATQNAKSRDLQGPKPTVSSNAGKTNGAVGTVKEEEGTKTS